ncbi:alcohol dehydrogenase catalytic domain-containing protein [Streptomyces sp. NRRL F-5630]|uniref:alcohol dehydrogenase catalytic domain-containing protein n=1 Tax=Streptomyces sp. NRRL F-5630 TaxID=1463864 RepID=UPI003D717C8D
MLRVVDVPPLAAGPGQVRLAVRSASVNPLDWTILNGSMRQVTPVGFPAGLGSDVADVVDQVGEDVTYFSVGGTRCWLPPSPPSARQRTVSVRAYRLRGHPEVRRHARV